MNLFARTLLLALLGVSTLAAHAQNQLFVAVDYMHIPESKSDDSYIATEKLWQRLHQRAVDAGICLGWYLDRVENGGRGDFVTVRVYNSLDKMTNPWPDSIQKDLYNAEESKTMNQTGETRELIHSELWSIEAAVGEAPPVDPSIVISVEFMKPVPGKGGEYYNLEKNTYTKVHEARIKAGEMKNWYFLSRMFPSGTDSDYDYITINAYPKNSVGWNEKIVETALGKEAAAKLANPGTIRTMIRREVWHPILSTTPAKK